MINIWPFCTREITFVTSFLLFCTPSPFEKESTLKEMNFLPSGSKSLPNVLTAFQKAAKKILTMLYLPEKCIISPLNAFAHYCVCIPASSFNKSK